MHLVNLITSEGCVRCHEEVTARCWNEGCYDADEIVVHVARVAKSLGRGGHDSGYLMKHF
jgi:hypothetical protein